MVGGSDRAETTGGPVTAGGGMWDKLWETAAIVVRLALKNLNVHNAYNGA